MKTLLLAAKVGLVLSLSSFAWAGAIYSDGIFNLGNYTSTPIYTSGAATASVTRCSTCGNPGSALQISATFSSTAGSYARGAINNTFVYDPHTQGAISSIAASVDKNATLDVAVTNFGNSFRPLIEQDGVYYLATIAGNTVTYGSSGGSTGFITFSAPALVATDFTSYDFNTGTLGTANPDFNGDPLSLGLAQILTVVAGTGPGHDTIVYDNLNFNVASQTPEPSSLTLLGSGLAAVATLVRRRRLTA